MVGDGEEEGGPGLVPLPQLLLRGRGSAESYEVENLANCRGEGGDHSYWVEHFMRHAPSLARYALQANRFLRTAAASGGGATSSSCPLPEEEEEQEQERAEAAAASQFVREWTEWSATLQVRSSFPLLMDASTHASTLVTHPPTHHR